MFVSQKTVTGINPMTDVGICPKVQPGTSRTLSEIYATSHRPPFRNLTVRLYGDGGTFFASGGSGGGGKGVAD